MSFFSSLVGKNPKITLQSNPKTNSIAIVETRGKAGTFKVDLIKVALSALAFLVACLVGAPLNFILVGIGSVCLYASIKRYVIGAAEEGQAEWSRAAKTAESIEGVAENTFM
jgi:hypothetical protein